MEKKNYQKQQKLGHLKNKNNQKGINVSSEKDGRKKIDKNYGTIAVNVSYAKKDKLYPAHVSKQNSNCEKQVILSMISNKEKLWYFLVVKKYNIY